MVEIVIVDQTPAGMLSYSDVTDAAGMLQAWLDHEVAPAWSQGAYKVSAGPRGTTSVPGTDHRWLFYLLDSSDVAGAGGYHSIDARGAPFARIFVGDAKRANYPWSIILTHEAAETCVNRFVDAMVLAPYQGADAAYFTEVGDPFEGGPSYPFHYNGQLYQVCNFALPAYWKTWHPGPYDRLGLGTAPLTPTPGGMQTVYPLNGQPVQYDHTGKATPLADGDHPHVSRIGENNGGVILMGGDDRISQGVAGQ